MAIIFLLTIACGGSPTEPTTTTGPETPVTSSPPPPAAPATGCGITAPGPGNGLDCPREIAHFLTEVDQAIDRVVSHHPEYFDLDDTSGHKEYLVLRPAPFVIGVIRELEGMGLCAAVDTKELQVKRTNELNDQYHLILSSGHIRRGFPSYRATCSPAAFPTPSAPIGPPEGCALPPSRPITCERTGETPAFLADVERAIDTLRSQRPEIFDRDLVLDTAAYHTGVARLLTTGGRCARFDGEEIALKSSNQSSEQYRILLSSGHVRRGEGAWRATCYPAAF